MNNICQNCKKARATVHLTEIDPESHEPHEMHLCEDCARDSSGLQKKPKQQKVSTISFTTSIVGLGGKQGGTATPPSKIVCPDCGMTNQEFRLKGRFGCVGCYDVFEESLTALLEKVHGATQYVGPHPVSAAGRHRTVAAMEQELVDLRRRMNRLVKSENYEQAAELRDQIDEIEQQLLEPGDA